MNVYMTDIRYVRTLIFQKRLTRRFSIPCSSVKTAEKNLGRENRKRGTRQAHREYISTKTLSEQRASPCFLRPIRTSTAGPH